MSELRVGCDVFSTRRDLVDVTSNHRPNVGRIITDQAGHAHPWCGSDGQPAASYSPSAQYNIPSLMWVKDGEECWPDDDEPHEVGHHECRMCGERVEPPFTADTWQMHIAGMRHCYVNGTEVTREEYERRVEKAKAEWHHENSRSYPDPSR
jgi:hypothetical protein